MTLSLFKNLDSILIPIENSAVDALPLSIMIVSILTGIIIIRKNNYPLLRFGRLAIRLLSFILFIFYFHQCICMIREWIFGFQSIGLDAHSAFKRLVVPFILFSGTLIAGKIFCGWICPFGFGLELLGRIPFLKNRPQWFNYLYLTLCTIVMVILLLRHSPDTRFIMENITSIWVLLMTIFLFFVVKYPNKNFRNVKYASLYIWVPSVFIGVYMTNPWCIVYGNELDHASIISLVGVLMTGLMFSSAWCFYACPLGAITSVLSKYSILKKKTPPDSCYYNLVTKDRSTLHECYFCGRCTKNLETTISTDIHNEN